MAAIDGGLSCRAAAERFGVGVATAIRWRQMALAHGRAVAGKPCGDQRSSKTEAHAGLIMAMLEENGDITLAEIRTGLAERDIAVEVGAPLSSTARSTGWTYTNAA